LERLGDGSRHGGLDVDESSTYFSPMKAVQVTLDEELLAQLDADPEVKRDGRSAVMRRATAEYLRRKRRASIADAYRRGYGAATGRDLEAWADEGVWPDE
jgi:predicted transcriptional regulator